MRPHHNDFPQRLPRDSVAVYALVYNDEVMYVGKSTNVWNRVSRHKLNYQRWLAGRRLKFHQEHEEIYRAIPFDSVHVRYCHKRELDNLEFMLIRKYKPEYNVQHMEVYDFVEDIRLGRTVIDLEALGMPEWMGKPSSDPFLGKFTRRV